MSLETDQQKLEQQKLEQAKQEKSSTPENNQESTDNKFTTDTGEKLAEWRSQRENKESSEGTEGASDTGRRSLDMVKEQLAQENNPSLNDNLDNRNVEPNQDISPEDSTQDDTELEKQRKNIESDINLAQDKSTNAQVEAQKAEKDNQEALEAEQKPDLAPNLQEWLKNKRDTTRENVQVTSDKATEAEQNLQDLRRQLEDLPKPKR